MFGKNTCYFVFSSNLATFHEFYQNLGKEDPLNYRKLAHSLILFDLFHRNRYLGSVWKFISKGGEWTWKKVIEWISIRNVPIIGFEEPLPTCFPFALSQHIQLLWGVGLLSAKALKKLCNSTIKTFEAFNNSHFLSAKKWFKIAPKHVWTNFWWKKKLQ